MIEILPLKEKDLNSTLILKDLLMHFSNTHLESDRILHKLEESKKKVNEVAKDVSDLEDEFNKEKHILESKIKVCQEYIDLLQKIKVDEETSSISLKELESKQKIMKNVKMSVHDEELLASGRRKYQLYKEFTGIRWDLTAPESIIEGYITNKKNYIHRIFYKSDIEYKTLRDILWKEIEQSTVEEPDENIENMPANV